MEQMMNEIEKKNKKRIERGIKRRKKDWQKDPTRVERGKIVAMKMMGEKMEEEYPLQAKVSVVDLANLALGFYNRGDHGALRSLSALGQAAIAIAAIQMVEWEGLEEITSINEAISLLEELRLVDRNVKALNRGAILRNKIREGRGRDPEIVGMARNREETLRTRRAHKGRVTKDIESPEEAERMIMVTALKHMRDMGMPTIINLEGEIVEITFDEEGEPIIPQKAPERPPKLSAEQFNKNTVLPGLKPPERIQKALEEGTYKPGLLPLEPHMDATWSNEKKLEVFKERSNERIEKEQ